jgi:hypothetical protein
MTAGALAGEGVPKIDLSFLRGARLVSLCWKGLTRWQSSSRLRAGASLTASAGVPGSAGTAGAPLAESLAAAPIRVTASRSCFHDVAHRRSRCVVVVWSRWPSPSARPPRWRAACWSHRHLDGLGVASRAHYASRMAATDSRRRTCFKVRGHHLKGLYGDTADADLAANKPDVLSDGRRRRGAPYARPAADSGRSDREAAHSLRWL